MLVKQQQQQQVGKGSQRGDTERSAYIDTQKRLKTLTPYNPTIYPIYSTIYTYKSSSWKYIFCQERKQTRGGNFFELKFEKFPEKKKKTESKWSKESAKGAY